MRTEIRLAAIAAWSVASLSAVGQQCEWRYGPGQTAPALNGPVYAAATYDAGSGRELYFGGIFTQAGDLPVYGIAQ